MKRILLTIISIVTTTFCWSQTIGSFSSANEFFDDGRKGNFSSHAKRLGDLVIGLIEDNTGQYVTYRKVTTKDNGALLTDGDIIKGRGIYRKKNNEFFKLNFDGPANIRWFGAIPDGKTDNSESIKQALEATSFIKIPVGNFAISSPIVINSTAQILGEGPQHSRLICLDKNMSGIVLGNSNTNLISLLRFSDFTILNGKYGISATRESLPKIIIERSHIQNMNFELQSEAGIYFRGKHLLFLVNTLQENAFRYCGTGVYLDKIFSANLNHIQLNRFEGTVGGIFISTTNNELSQLTIHKNRFEAIIKKQSLGSPINIFGGNQNVSISDNYFEDVPDPVITIDASNGISIAPSVTNNQFSANINGAIMIKLASQVKAPYIVSNVFKPGQKGTKLDFGTFVSQPIIKGNYGDVEFISYPVSYKSFENTSIAQIENHVSSKKNISHSGNFKFDLQLPSSGIFNISILIAEDGDFSLGGVASYKVGWISADAPILFSQQQFSKYNPNTSSIRISAPSLQGKVSIEVQKADKKTRIATCYYAINAEMDINLANIKGE